MKENFNEEYIEVLLRHDADALEEMETGRREIIAEDQERDILNHCLLIQFKGNLGMDRVVYVVTEQAANEELKHIKRGSVGFDTEFGKRIMSPTEKSIFDMKAPNTAAKKTAKSIVQYLELISDKGYQIKWENAGLCIVQISAGATTWVLNMKRIKGKPSAFNEQTTTNFQQALPHELERILTSPEIVLAGAGLTSDVSVIWEDLRIDMQELADVGLMTRLWKPEEHAEESFQNLALEQAAQEVLGITIDKSRQKNVDWKSNLSDADIIYAAIDAAVSLRLYERLEKKLAEKEDTIGKRIPRSWYSYNMTEGEVTRIDQSYNGKVIPWSMRDCSWPRTAWRVEMKSAVPMRLASSESYSARDCERIARARLFFPLGTAASTRNARNTTKPQMRRGPPASQSDGSKQVRCLDFPSDFELGPEHILPQGNIVQYYCEKPSGKVLRTLLVGTLTAIIERKNEPNVVILSPPNSDSGTIRAIFTKQTNILNQIMQHENHDITRRIINKEVWSQGTGEYGKVAVYVRTTEETQMASNADLSISSSNFNAIDSGHRGHGRGQPTPYVRMYLPRNPKDPSSSDKDGNWKHGSVLCPPI
ncbi:ribonuclease H-like domain-containing protein [Mycena polygramma]|nr:ribonuclease H-like domain-containing protein [Mycena polygramma]